MNWSALIPAVIALFGIPLGVFLTGRRDDRVRRELWKHEEQIAARQQSDWVQQQWWHEKQKTYALLIEAMYQLKTEADNSLAYAWNELDGSATSSREQTQSRWKENLDHVKRTNEIGAFTVSETAANVIADYFATRRQLQRAWDDEALNPIDVYEADAAATKKCLADLRLAALLDLGVSPRIEMELS